MSSNPVPHDCRAFLDDFSAFIDGELPAARRGEYQAHVDCCQTCLAHLAAYRRGITVLRSVEEAAPVDFWTRLEQRLWVGPALSVVDGKAAAPSRRRGTSWPGPAVSLAAAAVLGLFMIVRGLGPGSTPGDVGPRTVSASVAMTVPEVPSAGPAALAPATVSRSTRSAPRRSGGSPEVVAPGADPAALALARAETGTSVERELLQLQRSALRQGLGRSARDGFAADGWVQPVRLGNEGSRVSIVPATLLRPAASVTPAPWNVDRAVNLP
ncbi:MAG TPA: zf-HC2 domain-containing protein [Gemmatimonadota bacterium]|nr:zf-HC2 domain-containing protein [Gemmatimonadota bacterium]